MACEIQQLTATPRPLDFGRYHALHDDGRRLIRGWLERARTGEDGDFASFIYLWIAFNGWAACVTGADADRTGSGR